MMNFWIFPAVLLVLTAALSNDGIAGGGVMVPGPSFAALARTAQRYVYPATPAGVEQAIAAIQQDPMGRVGQIALIVLSPWRNECNEIYREAQQKTSKMKKPPEYPSPFPRWLTNTEVAEAVSMDKKCAAPFVFQEQASKRLKVWLEGRGFFYSMSESGYVASPVAEDPFTSLERYPQLLPPAGYRRIVLIFELPQDEKPN